MEPQLAVDSWLVVPIGLMVVASAATWLWFLLRWSERGAILPFAPRRAVPWDGIALVPAVVLVSLTIFGLAAGEASDLDDLTWLKMVNRIGSGALFVAALTGLTLAAVIWLSGANRRDLGLPTYAHELIGDIGIGAVAFLAALVPVYGLQAMLVYGIGQESTHPLIQMIIADPNPLLLLVAFASAVIVAPICEEIAFRLLLQGWLEKRLEAGGRRPEDMSRDGRPAAMAESETAAATLCVAGAATSPTADTPVNGSDAPAPRPLSPVPIVLTSLLFAVAHVGHGPDPIPLFVLAVMLGYIYQRTHRIVPCIIVHMLFNAFSLTMLMTLILQEK